MIAVPAFRLVYLLTVRIVAWGSRPQEGVRHAVGGSDRQPGNGLAPHAITTLAGTCDAIWSAARPGLVRLKTDAYWGLVPVALMLKGLQWWVDGKWEIYWDD
jgi:hypothetical protein